MKNVKFILSVLLIAFGALGAMASEDPNPDEIIVYKETEQGKLSLHLFYPEGHQRTDKLPVIVLFHGGGWNGGTPEMFYQQCDYLASRGIVAITAQYRLKKKNKTTPIECVKDGKSAIRWIRKNADTIGVDPNKIIAGGGSAGGHVAAATGTATSFEEETDDKTVSYCPQALILFNPVYDNSETGYGHSKVKAYWKEISPMHNLTEKTPPTLVMLGTEDALIPVATAQEYKRQMEALGIRSELVLYAGEPHGFFNYSKNKKMYQETIEEAARFLTSLGYLEPIEKQDSGAK